MFADIRAIRRNDPACRNIEFLLYPSLHAILGPVKIGDNVKVGAPAHIVKRDGKKVNEALPISAYHLEERGAE